MNLSNRWRVITEWGKFLLHSPSPLLRRNHRFAPTDCGFTEASFGRRTLAARLPPSLPPAAPLLSDERKSNPWSSRAQAQPNQFPSRPLHRSKARASCLPRAYIGIRRFILFGYNSKDVTGRMKNLHLYSFLTWPSSRSDRSLH